VPNRASAIVAGGFWWHAPSTGSVRVRIILRGFNHPGSEAVGRFDPPAPASIFAAAAQSANPGQALSGKVWLIVGLFLLILAAAFRRIVYFSAR